MRSCKAADAGRFALPRSALLPSLLNPTNNCWQGNDQNPIFQASQNPGAEHLTGHSLKLAIAFQDRYLDRIVSYCDDITNNIG